MTFGADTHPHTIVRFPVDETGFSMVERMTVEKRASFPDIHADVIFHCIGGQQVWLTLTEKDAMKLAELLLPEEAATR